jgi:hypothetical protein
MARSSFRHDVRTTSNSTASHARPDSDHLRRQLVDLAEHSVGRCMHAHDGRIMNQIASIWLNDAERAAAGTLLLHPPNNPPQNRVGSPEFSAGGID